MNTVLLNTLRKDAETVKNAKGVLAIHPHLLSQLAGYLGEDKKSTKVLLADAKVEGSKLFGADYVVDASVLTWELRLP